MQSLGEFVLGQTCAFSRFNHKIAESALAFRMDRFVEFARAGSHRRGRLIRSSDYPKKGYILTLLLHYLPSQVDFPATRSELPLSQFGGFPPWMTSSTRDLHS